MLDDGKAARCAGVRLNDLPFGMERHPEPYRGPPAQEEEYKAALAHRQGNPHAAAFHLGAIAHWRPRPVRTHHPRH